MGAELALLTRRLRIAAAAVIIAASAASCGTGSATTTATGPCPTQPRGLVASSARVATHDVPPPVPASGAYLGAFALTGGFSQHRYVASVADLEDEICRPLAIVHSYLQWNHPFPMQSQLNVTRSGQILLLSWTGTDMAEMASGVDDAEIRTVAAKIAALHSPVFVELRWEMDRPNLIGEVHSPAAFIAAWDHTRAVFAAAGVHNASWVWCPTSTGFDLGTAQSYYPGASEVDWICTDAYPTSADSVEQLKDELSRFLAWAKPQGKPIMLGELGVPESYSPADRRDWIDNAAKFVKQTPQIKAVVYFDYHPQGHGADRNYRLAPGTSAALAFRSLAADPWFRPSLR